METHEGTPAIAIDTFTSDILSKGANKFVRSMFGHPSGASAGLKAHIEVGGHARRNHD